MKKMDFNIEADKPFWMSGLVSGQSRDAAHATLGEATLREIYTEARDRYGENWFNEADLFKAITANNISSVIFSLGGLLAERAIKHEDLDGYLESLQGKVTEHVAHSPGKIFISFRRGVNDLNLHRAMHIGVYSFVTLYAMGRDIPESDTVARWNMTRDMVKTSLMNKDSDGKEDYDKLIAEITMEYLAHIKALVAGVRNIFKGESPEKCEEVDQEIKSKVTEIMAAERDFIEAHFEYLAPRTKTRYLREVDSATGLSKLGRLFSGGLRLAAMDEMTDDELIAFIQRMLDGIVEACRQAAGSDGLSIHQVEVEVDDDDGIL